MRKSFLFFLCVFTILTFSSCSVFLSSHRATIIPSDDSTHVKQLKSNGTFAKTFVGQNKIDIGLDRNLIFVQERDGYISQTSVLRPTKFNWWKLGDIAMAPVILYMSTQVYNKDLQFLYYYAIPCFVFLPTFKKFPSRIELPQLTPIPTRDTSEVFLEPGNVSMNLPTDSIVMRLYNSVYAYTKHRAERTETKNDPIVAEYTSFDNELYDVLLKAKYIDSTLMSIGNTSVLKLDVCMNKAVFHYISGIGGCVELTTLFSLKNVNTDEAIYSATIKDTSRFFSSGGYDTDYLISDALGHATYTFLLQDEVKSQLKSSDNKISNPADQFSTITLSDTIFASSKTEAVNAVVTLQKSDSHGSGCLISIDGYIVTNFHVSGKSDTSIVAIFEDGHTQKCTIIRYNPVYDLALLKTDPVSIKPLKIIVSQKIDVGTDVFAIGAPLDISFGQTITRGIISGIRVSADKTFIQTDVAVNPGNSGGALIGTDGQLLGIINAKIAGKDVQRIGFAIPAWVIDVALKIKQAD